MDNDWPLILSPAGLEVSTKPEVESMYREVINVAIRHNEIASQLRKLAAGDPDEYEKLVDELRSSLVEAESELQPMVESQDRDFREAEKAFDSALRSYMIDHFPEYKELVQIEQQLVAEARQYANELEQRRREGATESARVFLQQVNEGRDDERGRVGRRWPTWLLPRSRGESIRSGADRLRQADRDLATQLKALQRKRRAIADVATNRKVMELRLAQELSREPEIGPAAQSKAAAEEDLRRSLLEIALLPHARSWIAERKRGEVDAAVSRNETWPPSLADQREHGEAGNREIVTSSGTDSSMSSQGSLAAAAGAPGPGDRRSVFLVHGRDERGARAIRDLLRALGLRVVEWEHAVRETGDASPYVGDVVLAGMRMADAVVVLLTPDDTVQLRQDLVRERDSVEEREIRGQARPNVIYEAGIADALDRSRTILVEIGIVKSLSDLHGRNVVRFDGQAASRHRLASRLKNARLTVDTDGQDWLQAGDFEASIDAARKAFP